MDAVYFISNNMKKYEEHNSNYSNFHFSELVTLLVSCLIYLDFPK